MKTETKHTPTPWAPQSKARKPGTFTKPNPTQMIVGPDGNTVADFRYKNGAEDAAHTLLCVNSHDALIAALKNALNVMAGIATGDLDTVTKDSPAIKQAREALAAAQVGPC